MPRARAVAVPKGGLIETGEQNRGYRLISGSMGAPSELPPIPAPAVTASVAALPTVETFEPGSDAGDDWARQVQMREAAEGLPMNAIERVLDHLPADLAQRRAERLEFRDPDAALAPPRPPVDLSPLPDRFALEVERKPNGWWIVRAPGVHIGLFVMAEDLAGALSDAPATLAEIVRLDGMVAKGRKRK